jgi:sugar phosphate isomerase/epimerase
MKIGVLGALAGTADCPTTVAAVKLQIANERRNILFVIGPETYSHSAFQRIGGNSPPCHPIFRLSLDSDDLLVVRKQTMNIDRRRFLEVSLAATLAGHARAATAQPFTAGAVPSGRLGSAGHVEEYWNQCDELAQLGFRAIEINNTRVQIAEYYADRVPEFRQEMSKRGLTLAGLALFSRAAESSDRTNLLNSHMLLGKFLSAVGGLYITHMIAVGEILNESQDDSVYSQIDLKTWARNADEIGKRLREDHGIRLGYHPEQGEIRTGLYKRFLDSTDDRYVYFLPDTGHLASGGADAVEICRTYRARLLGVHLKDFSPKVTTGKGLKAGNVPFGEGVVDLPGVVTDLRRTEFRGYVMGEGGGANAVMRDFMTGKLHLRLS